MTTESTPLREDSLFADLLELLQCQELADDELERLKQGFSFGRQAHEGQKRHNGDNYITHPVEVAQILATMRADTDTLIAALLHDVLEDTPVNDTQIQQAFGPEVLHLVQGVTKLGKYKFSSKEEAHAENFRKMFLAMSEDVRIITLKLADRLHNMRTLTHLRPDKQQRIAKETLDIFAPLANRLGMGNLRAELEDLSLSYLHPDSYKTIEEELAQSQTSRALAIEAATLKIRRQLDTEGIEAKIYGRVKNYYSIFKKMTRQEKALEQIFDISALRIIVDTESSCYKVLGTIHSLFTPVAGRFKDYIGQPKSNFYQSLHTTVIGPMGRPLEVQIRTHAMHEVAEYGIAAHFAYKQSGHSAPVKISSTDQQLAWLRQMQEMKNETGNAQEYVDNVRLDLFPDQVFVFTPNGDVVSLPRGATPVDFAFRIHTEVGNHCQGAIVNERMVPLDTELMNGDIIEIVTNRKVSPKLDWLNFVQTQQAKARIRQWYKKNYRDQHERQGRQLLEAELTRAEVDRLAKAGRLQEVAEELNYGEVEDMLAALGYGELPMPRVKNRLRKKEEPQQTKPQQLSSEEAAAQKRERLSKNSQVLGLKGLQYSVAKCCMPVPGDAIIGVVTRSRGVMIHRDDCLNLNHANPERLMDISWDGPVSMMKTQKKHRVGLEIQVLDRIGVLKDILTQVAESQINVLNAKSHPLNEEGAGSTELTLEVTHLNQLDSVIERIRQLPDVVRVKRRHHRLNR